MRIAKETSQEIEARSPEKNRETKRAFLGNGWEIRGIIQETRQNIKELTQGEDQRISGHDESAGGAYEGVLRDEREQVTARLW